MCKNVLRRHQGCSRPTFMVDFPHLPPSPAPRATSMELPLNAGTVISRRGFVQVGASTALGLSIARNVSASEIRPRKAKSVIIVFLTGAASHHDTFDMKPDAPPEIRGLFKPISTSIPGLQVCEHLPLLATRMNRCALVR